MGARRCGHDGDAAATSREENMERLGIEFISVFGMPPVATVNLAANLGYRYISAVLTPLDYNPHGYLPYSLRDDKKMRRETIAALRDRGISISLGEGFVVQPGIDVREAYARDLDIMSELGVGNINTLTFDPDISRSFDQFAHMAEMAAAVGIKTNVEFAPCFTVADLPTALAAVHHVKHPDFRILVDTMHLMRSGGSAADIAALDPNLIGYVQLCDVPAVSKFSSYMEEAMYERMPPGMGELPLFEILDALPRSVVIGLEIPQRSLAEAGVGPEIRLARCFEAGRKLLAGLNPERRPARSIA
jgi:sugar phosphate isomerase/epimerase